MSKKKKKLPTKSTNPTKTEKVQTVRVIPTPVSKSVLAIIGAIILSISIGLYIQTYTYDYVLDDVIVITENSFTQKGFSGISDLLFNESFVGYFKEQKDLIPGARYRPLSIITFAIEYQIMGGFNSSVSHVINVLMYAFVGFLLFLFLQGLFQVKQKKWYLSIAFLTTILWMLHATHTEVVANIKGRDEIMSLLFSLLTLIFSFRYADNKGKSWLNLGLAGIFFFLGLLSKENTITFLAIIPLSLFIFRDLERKKYINILAVLLVIFASYIGLRYAAVGYLNNGLQSQDVMNNPFVGLSTSESFSMIFYVLLKYIHLSIFPYPLTHDYYPFQIPKVGWDNIWVLLSLVLHFALGIWAVLKLKSKNIWAYIIIFYIASLSIYSNIVINVGTTMNERFLFVATIATCLAIVYGLSLIAKKFNLSLILPIGVLLFGIVYAGISFQRIPVWRNTLSLNEAAIKVSTNSARANSFMGTALYNEAKTLTDKDAKLAMLTDASKYADKAVQLLPIYYNGNLMKAGIAAEIYQIDRDANKLLTSFYDVAKNRPDVPFLKEYHEYLLDRVDAPTLINYHLNVAYRELIPKNNLKWALSHLNYAIQLAPNDARVNYAMSVCLRHMGRTNDADNYYAKAVQIDPGIQEKMR